MRSLLIGILLLVPAGAAFAADTGAVDVPAAEAGKPKITGKMRYNEGETLARAQAWKQAEAAFAEATLLEPELPEAWNGLGHARKMQERYPEALTAYKEALRLRPNFPQALEYLGETYVAMGKADEARRTLERLKPLDAKLAEQLERAIDGQKSAAGW